LTLAVTATLAPYSVTTPAGVIFATLSPKNSL